MFRRISYLEEHKAVAVVDVVVVVDVAVVAVVVVVDVVEEEVTTKKMDLLFFMIIVSWQYRKIKWLSTGCFSRRFPLRIFDRLKCALPIVEEILMNL